MGLTGCDWLLGFFDEQDPEAQVVVDAMAYGDYNSPDEQNWERIVGEFEALNPNIDIQYEMRCNEAYHTRVTERLAAGNVPDLAYMGTNSLWGTPWKNANQQFDHNPYLDASYYDLNLIPQMSPTGARFYIPIGTSIICTVLYMNKTLVNGLGFETPQTYTDIVAMVGAANTAGLDVISVDGVDGWAWGSCLMSSVIARLSGAPHWVTDAVAGVNHFTDQVFVDALSFLNRMVNDGVLAADCLTVDYSTNITRFNNSKALFMIQGGWAAFSIDSTVADNTLMLAFPALPNEVQGVTTGSVAAAIQVGYGVTKSGASDPAVLDAALKFLKYFNSYAEVTQRLRDGAIIAPVLKNYVIPADLSPIAKQKATLGQTAGCTDVIDAFLSGAPNDALNSGMQNIVNGTALPVNVAAEVEGLARL